MPLVAQLTLPSDAPFFVRLGASGQRKDGAADWHEAELVWSHARGRWRVRAWHDGRRLRD